VAAIIAVCVVIATLETWHAWDARSTAITADQVETRNLARSLALHAHDLLQTVDSALQGVRERLERDGDSPVALLRLHNWMLKTTQNIPLIHGMFAYDAAGNYLTNSLTANRLSLNNSDRAYFRYHRDHDDDVPFFGEPVRSKTDGSWIITVSRRVNGPDRSFKGVVLASISIEALRQFYATFDIGNSGVITLLSSSGIVMAREPVADKPAGSNVSAGVIFRELLPHAPAGEFSTIYAADGLHRIGSYRQVDDYPFIIVCAHGLDDVLREWRVDVRWSVVVCLITMLALGVIGVRFARQMRNTEKAEREYRLLADNSSDVIACIGLDGKTRYLSPAFTTLTQWPVSDGLDRPWYDFVHPEDRSVVTAIRAELDAGADATATFRYVCKDDTVGWAEIRVRLVAAVDGGKPQFVGNLRDITKRKLIEAQVTALNEQLAVFAVTDGLTGLANRRRFDEALETAWRLAMRKGFLLALLMIDVDQFKQYNDHYGHQEGDRCLQIVAAAIGNRVRRAGEIAARYGGEEFAVLLSDTDASAAARLAEDIRTAVQAGNVRHEPNQPAGVVTVSIGVAAITPIPNDAFTQPADLLARADAALYAAKRAGRNTVSVTPEVTGYAASGVVTLSP
jgi:diguanylate cyclase (GGDEF)-like protein/PAS domain S-box-containing protein